MKALNRAPTRSMPLLTEYVVSPSVTLPLRTRTARRSCNPNPQPTVRQFTARRFDENAATIPKKKKTPAMACPRGPIESRVPHAAAATATIAAAIATRQVSGVGNSAGAAVDGAVG